MAAKIRRRNEPIPLSPPVFYILLAVADGPRHGYAIMQEVDRRSDGKLRLLPGSMYSTIRRMLSEDLLEECDSPAPEGDDERRRYYRMTDAGREIAAAEVERLSTLLDFAESKQLTTPRSVASD